MLIWSLFSAAIWFAMIMQTGTSSLSILNLNNPLNFALLAVSFSCYVFFDIKFIHEIFHGYASFGTWLHNLQFNNLISLFSFCQPFKLMSML
ncbi:hypothetical protein VNO78_12974 [Psophocarpus tetragonolobus]|uniref:Uncharacterized protein n=1 Tax=Psophocarpus tetragonolobus TaxID=3891 RepID=A0AAN9SNP6_PSOTE